MEANKNCVQGECYMKYPFGEPKNTAIITCSHIVENDADILYVSHDEEDGMWQFLCGGEHIMKDARVISLNEIFTIDNTIFKLSNMPCGYIAERESKHSEWVMKKR